MFKKITDGVRNFARDERGDSGLEYAALVIIAAALVALAAAAVSWAQARFSAAGIG